jgi:hypothetical protein
MNATTRRSEAARLRKRAEIHRLRCIGSEPEAKAMELALAKRLTRIAHGLETNSLPEIGKPT